MGGPLMLCGWPLMGGANGRRPGAWCGNEEVIARDPGSGRGKPSQRQKRVFRREAERRGEMIELALLRAVLNERRRLLDDEVGKVGVKSRRRRQAGDLRVERLAQIGVGDRPSVT